jgi:hypothetical protein
MTIVWAANLDTVDPVAGGRPDVRLVDTLGAAAAWLDRVPGEPLVVIGPDVRFFDVAAFAGYVRGMRHPTALVLVRHPEEIAVVHEARVAGIVEVVRSGRPEDLELACGRAVGARQPTPDRAPTRPTVFTPRPVDPSSVARLDTSRSTAGPRTTDGLGPGCTMTSEAADLLATCVRDRLNVVITGAPGAGKTTLLTSMAALAPARERLVTLDNGAASAVFDTMSGEHRGSLTTLVAHSPQEALVLLESALPDDAGSRRTARARLAATVDVLVHVASLPDGTHRITHITEVRGIAAGAIATEDRYRLDAAPAQLTG